MNGVISWVQKSTRQGMAIGVFLCIIPIFASAMAAINFSPTLRVDHAGVTLYNGNPYDRNTPGDNDIVLKYRSKKI